MKPLTSCVCRVSYINPNKFTWGALMISIFAGTDARGANGQPVLEYYSISEDLMWAYIGYSSLFSATFLLVAWLALSYLQHQKR